MRSAVVLLGAALLGALAGCGSSREETDKLVQSYQVLLHEQVGAQEQALQILASAKDRASMTAALEQLKGPYVLLDKTAAGLKRLGWPPPPEIQKRLEQEKAEVGEAAGRLLEEIRRIRDLPGGEAFLDGLKQLQKPHRP